MNTTNPTMTESCDIAVIGSGPAAGLYAARAAAAGHRVILLEAGPERRLEQLYSSQLWARQLKWGGSPVEERGNHKVGHAFNSGWGSGGGGMHHYAVYPRMHPSDFKVKTDHGYGLDWPFEYAQLRSHYDRVQVEIGISGDAAKEHWRPDGDDYPMPAMPLFGQSRLIAEGFARRGMHTAPLPLAINSRPYNGRPSCQFDGWCDAGCPIGALANPLVTYLAAATAAGAELRCESTVTELLKNGPGHRLEGVRYRDASGHLQTLLADQVVLAAGTIENSRLLLANQLANSSGLVGRHLMSHPARSIYGLFNQPSEPTLGITGGQLICHDRYHPKRKSSDQFGSYQWLIGQAMKPTDLLGIANTRPDIAGAELDTFMREASKKMGNMVFVAEDIANPDNRVELTGQLDNNGQPLVRAIHNISSETAALVAAATAEGLEIFKAAGATAPWHGPLIGMHILGGTPMGSRPTESVANSDCRSHDVDNLWIAGSSLFPSSGAVNPTFTLLALADRGANAMLAAS